PKDATWDSPICTDIVDKLSVVKLVVWDKDMLRKDCLGELCTVCFVAARWCVHNKWGRYVGMP
ncbi:hypothetical protein K438DRAFT_1636791, partial [Mycena galopus ATCC 62051]